MVESARTDTLMLMAPHGVSWGSRTDFFMGNPAFFQMVTDEASGIRTREHFKSLMIHAGRRLHFALMLSLVVAFLLMI